MKSEGLESVAAAAAAIMRMINKGEFNPIEWKEIANCEKKKIKNQTISDLNLRFQQLIPSKTGFKNIKLDGRLSCANKFAKLNEVVGAIKHDLETHMKKGIDSQFLLKCVDKVIHIVDRYRNESKPQPFNWKYGTFPLSVRHMSKEFVEDVDDITWTSYQNASKLSDCDPTLSDSACIPPLWNEIWRVFKECAETPEQESKSSIELGHPIVSVIGDFAVAAFNEAYEMMGEHNVHDFEVMECKYLKFTNAFLFYMTIEAIEEGNLGVYETQVLCHSDGSRSLRTFILTDRNPAGTKAMAISLFSCVMSFCETLIRDTKEKENKLAKIFDATMGLDNGTAWALLDLLEEVSDATMKGLHKVLSLGLRLLFSPNCNRTTNPGFWCSYADRHFINWMVQRTKKGTPCSGCNYLNPIDLGSVAALR